MLKLFYLIKPFMPRKFQIYLRRQLAKLKRKKYKNIWPVLESAGNVPSGWPGWANGKKFAVVLTHDVEGQAGHDKCLNLMKLEKKLGYRSSFNFVPEKYEVSEGLRKTLVTNGFEVGVHGLNHDGKLFSSEQEFSERAKKINNYLNEWKSVGFRAPAMHHNLKWLHKLDLNYDLSTFDTDPFEPQSDGMKTIFPFWVSKNGNVNGSGYWEFPYTLVQDFTLFILMNENNEIWKRKVDWIVQKGGMVLVNVHPDYIGFAEKPTGLEEFPKKQYVGLLKYIKSKYKGEYWNPLPKDLAKYLDTNFPKEYACLKN
jgi:hypothetical protein